MTPEPWLDSLRFDAAGLLPIVTQDARTGNVLMLAWGSREALARSHATGEAHYWSRSRGALWRKGEESGNTQRLVEIRVDCDRDTILYRVDQTGPACHTGTPTCFAHRVTLSGDISAGDDPGGHLLARLARIIADRDVTRLAGSYTSSLFERGLPKISQKVGEEAVETIVAAHAESDERLASEAADLLYHLLVLLQVRGVSLDTVLGELAARER